jgi:hypothetical protein
MTSSEKTGEGQTTLDEPAIRHQQPGVDRAGESELSSDARAAEAARELDALFAAGGPPDFDDIAGPMHWPTATLDTNQAWGDLRRWVEQLVERFSHLDHHVIPLCWWRHNGHVEALIALRDHERMCYSDNSPPSAAVEWHRAFRDVEARLREWTSNLACGSTHDPRARTARGTDEGAWAEFIDADSRRRAITQPPHATPDLSGADLESTGDDEQDSAP